MSTPTPIEALRLRIAEMPSARRRMYADMLAKALALDAERQPEALRALSIRVTRADQIDSQRMRTRDQFSVLTLH